ncbi:MAG TPA: pyridoxal phosphate-dependent aminotransferase [Gemmatales bacterium]|nr:pyridoxal phosphate-dependent aminotransferase [Gemmatales bacterium]
MLPLSSLAQMIKPSATLAAGARAKQLRAQGVRVFDFSLGEPDFATPAHIGEAAAVAVSAGHTRYTPANGILPLREVLAQRYRDRYGLDLSPDDVVVSSGAKHAIFNTVATLCGPGDEVLIPTPFWTSYADIVEMTGARIHLVPTTFAQHFKLSAAQLRDALTPRTRLVLMNSPCNPTGTVYSRADLEALADVILERPGLAVLSDEIYECLVFDGHQHHCFAALRPELRDRCIVVSGASKTYAMTGWRMGWAIGPAHTIKAIGDIQSQQTGCPNSVSQYAVLAALQSDQKCVEDMRLEFQKRRDLVCEMLGRIPGLRFHKPEGAFYVFIDASVYMGKAFRGQKIPDSDALCQALFEHERVNLVPGAAFGAEGYLRLSYTSDRTEIKEGLERLAGCLAEMA